eukprot:COSAG02_NODE_756_length_17532_cov_5.673550_6_plen_98_part_00
MHPSSGVTAPFRAVFEIQCRLTGGKVSNPRKVPRIFAGVLLLDISGTVGCSELLGAEDTLTGRSNKSVLVLVFEPATEKLEIQSYDWNYGLEKTEPG